MPVLIDQISAEISSEADSQSQRANQEQMQAAAQPSPQQQLDALRRRLRQLEQRKARLKAD